MISIIVPVYNVERYIRKCLESILIQTFKDFEVIIIDDGSTDSCPNICDEYAKKDSRFNVIHKKNGGLSSARNAGLDAASGQYIALIDSDDWIATNMLEILYHNLINFKADISQCEFVKTKSEYDLGPVPYSNEQPMILTGKEMVSKFHDKNAIKYSIVCNKIYKAQLFHGIRFPVGKIHEDEFVNYKVVFRAKRVNCSKQKMYYYRQHASSIMANKLNLSKLNGLEAFLERKDFYKNKHQTTLYKNELKYILEYITIICSQLKNVECKDKQEINHLRLIYIRILIERMVALLNK